MSFKTATDQTNWTEHVFIICLTLFFNQQVHKITVYSNLCHIFSYVELGSNSTYKPRPIQLGREVQHVSCGAKSQMTFLEIGWKPEDKESEVLSVSFLV